MSIFGKAFSNMVMNIAGIDDDELSNLDNESDDSASLNEESQINPFVMSQNQQKGPNRSHRVNRDEPSFEENEENSQSESTEPLSKQIVQLEKELEEYKERLRSVELDKDSLSEEVSVFMEENKELKIRITEKASELERKDNQLINNQKAMKELMEENERINDEVKYLSDLLNSGEADPSKKMRDDMHMTIETLTKELSDLSSNQEQLEQQMKEKDEKILELSQERESLLSKVELNTSSDFNQENEILLLKEEKEQLLSSLEELKAQVETLSTTQTQLLNDIDEKKAEKAQVEINLSTLKEEETTVESSLFEAEANLSNLQKEAALLTQENDELKLSIQTLKEEQISLRTSIQELQEAEEQAMLGEDLGWNQHDGFQELQKEKEKLEEELRMQEERVHSGNGELVELKNAVDLKRSELDELLKEEKSLRESIEGLKKAEAVSDELVELKKSELDELSKEEQSLKESIEELRKAEEAVNGELVELKNAVDLKKNELTELNSQQTALQTSLEKLKDKERLLEEEYKSKKEELIQMNSSLISEKEEMEKSITVLKEEKEQLEESIEELKKVEEEAILGEKEVMNDELIELKNAVELKKNELNELSKEEQSLKKSIEELKKVEEEAMLNEKEVMNDELTELKNAVDLKKNELTELNSQQTALQTTITTLETTASLTKQEIKELTSSLQSLKEEETQVSVHINTLTDTKVQLEDQVCSLEQTIQELNSKKEKCELDIIAMEENMKIVENEVREMESTVTNLSYQKELEGGSVYSQDQISILHIENANLKKQVDALCQQNLLLNDVIDGNNKNGNATTTLLTAKDEEIRLLKNELGIICAEKDELEQKIEIMHEMMDQQEDKLSRLQQVDDISTQIGNEEEWDELRKEKEQLGEIIIEMEQKSEELKKLEESLTEMKNMNEAKSEELKKLEESLLERERKSEELKKLEESLLEMTNMNEAKSEELKKLEESLAERERKSEELKKLEESLVEREKKSEELKKLEESLAEMKNMNEAKSEELKKLEESLAERERKSEELKKLEESLAERERKSEELKKLEESLTEMKNMNELKSEELQKLEESLLETKRKNEELQQLEITKSKTIEDLKNQERELTATITQLKEKVDLETVNHYPLEGDIPSLQERNGELEELRSQAQMNTIEVERLKNEIVHLTACKTELENVTCIMKKQKEQIEEDHRLMKEMEETIDFKEKEIQQLKANPAMIPEDDGLSVSTINGEDFLKDLTLSSPMETADITVLSLYNKTIQELNTTKKELEDTRSKLLLTTSETQLKEEQIHALSNEIQANEASMLTSKQELDEALRMVSVLKLRIEDLESQKEEWKAALVTSAEQQADQDGVVEQYKRTMKEKEFAMKKMQDELTQLREKVHDKQTLTSNHAELQDKYEVLKTKWTEVEKNALEKEATIQEQTTVIHSLQSQIALWKQRYVQLHHDSEVLQSERNKAVEETTRMKSVYDSQQSELSVLQIRTRRADDVENQKNKEVEALKKELQNTQGILDMVQTELTKSREGCFITTSTGTQICTANPEVIDKYIQSLNSQIASLEHSLEEVKKTKQEELYNMEESKRHIKEQNELLTSNVNDLKTQLLSEQTMKTKLEDQLKKKEQTIDELTKEQAKQNDSLQTVLNQQLSSIQQSLKESEKRAANLEESLREANVTIQKRDKLIETAKNANEKLKKNEAVYRKAIEQLKAYSKEREEELERVYKSMKLLKSK